MELINRIRKSRKGFTLVEIIVVLVILAILAAFTIPAMLGFVDDAKGKAHIAEAREVYVAAQAAATETVAKQTGTAISGADLGAALSRSAADGVPSNAIMAKYIAGDVPGRALWTVTATATTPATPTTAATGKVEKVEYKVDGYTITIDKTSTATDAIKITKP